MDFSVEHPGEADAPAIGYVHNTSWRETYIDYLSADHFDDAALARRTQVWLGVLTDAESSQRMRVAKVDGTIVGFGYWTPESSGSDATDTSVIRNLRVLYVQGQYHGTGIGAALMDELIGTAPAVLQVESRNPRAIRFYEKNGFVIEDSVTEGDLETFVMRRQ